MFSSSLVAAAIAVAPTLVRAGLDKSVLFSQGLHDPLIAFDTIASSAITQQYNSSVPQICKDYGTGTAYGYDGDIQCDVANMEAREVYYEDCSQSWILCRCPDANMDFDTIAARFGQVPVGIRSYVGATLATNAGGCSAVTFNGEFIRFHGDCGMTVFLHESGHAMDQGASGSDEFQAAIAADSCVPDDYANSNNVEDWTQVDVMYTYQKKYGSIPADPSCLSNQWNWFNNDQRINEAQDATSCLADKRPFTVTNDQAPPTTTAAPVSTAAPVTTAAPETTPAAPVTTETTAPPTSTTSPNNCKSAKFRFRNRVKRAFEVVTAYTRNKLKGTVTVPYSG